jgi:hypothetical protein
VITRRRLIQTVVPLLIARPAIAKLPGLSRLKGGNFQPLVYSYPPNGPSFTNTFGTVAWTPNQLKDPGGSAHEQNGCFWPTLTPVGGSPKVVQPPGSFGLGGGMFAFAFGYNGVIFGLQEDETWYDYNAWLWQGAPAFQGDVTTPGDARSPGPYVVPTSGGPFTPSADGTSINTTSSLNLTVTSMDGVWSFDAAGTFQAHTGNAYTALLNGCPISYGPRYFQGTTITINSHSNTFLQAGDSSWHPFLCYSLDNQASGPTASPIPVGMSFSPSFISSTTLISVGALTAAGHNVTGYQISTLTVTMSDGSAFSGTTAFSPITGNWGAPYGDPLKIVGNRLQLARPLGMSNPDDTGVNHPYFTLSATQNGVTLGRGANYFIMNVVV